MKALLISLFLFSHFFPLFGQNYSCVTDELNHVSNNRNRSAEIVSQNFSSNEDSLIILKLPIVFHILWHDSLNNNLHDSVLNNQIEILNADFRHKNSDTTVIRDMFSGIVGDSYIEFYIANVVRVNTQNYSFSSFYDSDKIFNDSLGGSNMWNPEKYINVWVCNIVDTVSSTQIKGFALTNINYNGWDSVPNSIDGIVVFHKTIGTNNPFNEEITPQNQNTYKTRTLTHELGHYLGLYHNFSGCNFEDGISDVPPSDIACVNECCWNQNSSSSSGIDLPDMIENFMDYSSDECLVTFSKDQIHIMRECVLGPRVKLLETSNMLNHNDKVDSYISIYPNPSDGIFNIEIKHNTNYIKLNLLNVLGQSLNSYSIKSNSGLTINLNNYKKGTYILQFVKPSFEIQYHKIIIN